MISISWLVNYPFRLSSYFKVRYSQFNPEIILKPDAQFVKY